MKRVGRRSFGKLADYSHSMFQGMLHGKMQSIALPRCFCNAAESMLTGYSEGKQYCRRGGQTWHPKDWESLPDIELLTSPTPNGHKVSILLEELGVSYRVRCIDLGGEQFSEEFLAVCPNGKIPAVVDHSNGHTVFESGAELLYIAEKYCKFWPDDPLSKSKVTQWVMWQMVNVPAKATT